MIGGNLQNQSELLKKNLEKIGYPHILSFRVFQEENPMVFLQIIHHAVISFSEEFYTSLIDKGYELFSKSDKKFMESVFKFLFTEFDCKPTITISNFFTNTFLEQKLILTNTIIDIILKCVGTIASKPVAKQMKKRSFPNSSEEQMKQKLNEEVEKDEEQPRDPLMKSLSVDPTSISQQQQRIPQQQQRILSQQQQQQQQIHIATQQEIRQNKSHEESASIIKGKQASELKDPLDRPVTQRELNSMMELMVSMNSMVQETIRKFDGFQRSVGVSVQNIQAQLVVLDGEVRLLKAQQQLNEQQEDSRGFR